MRAIARFLVGIAFVASGLLGSAADQARVAVASAPAAPEDAPAQTSTLQEAYNLLMDRYVHPLDSAALLAAGWDELGKEADGKAATPGQAPTFTGDRAADVQAAQSALNTYLAKPNSSANGFVAVHALIRGMVHFVDEGHTYFLDPQQYADYQSWSRGDNQYVGIGISVSTRDSQPHIVEVYDDTPAAQAGLQAGDVLVSINGQSVANLQVEQMTTLVRGPAGTTVTLEVRRGDAPDTLTFSVKRAEIHLQFVSQKLVGDDIGYLLLRGFPEPSVDDTIEQDVANFEQAGVHGLVLDLRGNTGGRIDVGTRLLSDFLPPGTTVYQEVDRNGQDRMHFSRNGQQYDIPLVVLVDGGTASMGEIFASAVQEHGAATIVGSNTAGSVAAAQVFGLPDGSGIQVTVFEIRSSDGKQLNKIGVTPDDVIDPATRAPSGDDPAIDKAVEILHDQAAAGAAAQSN
ncbi:MAG: S41 family peptidase [Chloroflexi bacterium]|nr:S41 family peptidase [Chloroflexota bacterium]